MNETEHALGYARLIGGITFIVSDEGQQASDDPDIIGRIRHLVDNFQARNGLPPIDWTTGHESNDTQGTIYDILDQP